MTCENCQKTIRTPAGMDFHLGWCKPAAPVAPVAAASKPVRAMRHGKRLEAARRNAVRIRAAQAARYAAAHPVPEPATVPTRLTISYGSTVVATVPGPDVPVPVVLPEPLPSKYSEPVAIPCALETPHARHDHDADSYCPGVGPGDPEYSTHPDCLIGGHYSPTAPARVRVTMYEDRDAGPGIPRGSLKSEAAWCKPRHAPYRRPQLPDPLATSAVPVIGWTAVGAGIEPEPDAHTDSRQPVYVRVLPHERAQYRAKHHPRGKTPGSCWCSHHAAPVAGDGRKHDMSDLIPARVAAAA